MSPWWFLLFAIVSFIIAMAFQLPKQGYPNGVEISVKGANFWFAFFMLSTLVCAVRFIMYLFPS